MADPSAAPLPDGDAQTPQNEAAAPAAAAPNGTTNGSVDVEMKEDTPTDPTTSTALAAAPVDLPAAPTPPTAATTSTPPPLHPPAPPPAAAAAPTATTTTPAIPTTTNTTTTTAMPPRTGSPRPVGGGNATPNAGAAAAGPRQELPTQPNAHGSPTRVYLNQNVTPHLLEGMKRVALLEPEKPLKWLSEFLAERSKEYERD